MLEWTLQIADGAEPVYAQIVARLAADIKQGVLKPGARLPTQRALAAQLGLGLGSVTRAYAEAETRGLIEAVVGRGSFVAPTVGQARRDGPVYLSMNLPPLNPASASLRPALAALARRSDLVDRLDYAPDGGFPADREAATVWLRRAANLPDIAAGDVICSVGATQAIQLALSTLCRPGEAIVLEEATYFNVKQIAAHLRLQLKPAGMDNEGLTPESFERAVRESGARVAYVLPFQNPTARLMSLDRRRAIVEVARRLGVVIIEDDIYAPFVAERGLPPLVRLAPEQVVYVSSLSKGLAPGFRTGYLVAPPRFRPALLESQRATTFSGPTLGTLVATQWIESGEAFEVLDAILVETGRRAALAASAMEGLIEPLSTPLSPHVWMPLSELEAERVAGKAASAGVKVTPPQAPFIPGVPISGLRLCLGAAPDLASLEAALAVVRRAVDPAEAFAEGVA
jgi:DNA-binding transcriptional MocR family regulator